MKRLFYSILLSTLLIYSPVLFAKEKQVSSLVGITVEQAIKLAFKNYPQIQEAEQEIKASKARVGERQSGFYPDLSLEALYTKLYPDPSIAFGPLGTVQLYPEDNYDAHIALRQKVLDFGRTSTSVRAAKWDT